MGFKWSEAANRVSERVPAGVHHLTVTRILRGSKGGGEFKTRSGDPQIMVIFEDRNGAEVGEKFTLSDKAAGFMARLLSRGGRDLKRMEADGIDPKHFANTAIAEQWLLGLKTWARVHYEDGADGKSYGRVEPLTAEEAGQLEPAHATPEPKLAPSEPKPKRGWAGASKMDPGPPDPFFDAVEKEDEVPF